MLSGLDQEEWGRYALPTWSTASEISAAIRALADVGDRDRSRSYHRMLYALGNDHAGTYFPVVLQTIPFLGEILRGPVLIPRLRALDVLIDLVGSFQPEPGHEEVASAAGQRPLKAMVQEAAALLSSDVEHLHRHPGSDEEARLAGELLALIRE